MYDVHYDVHVCLYDIFCGFRKAILASNSTEAVATANTHLHPSSHTEFDFKRTDLHSTVDWTVSAGPGSAGGRPIAYYRLNHNRSIVLQRIYLSCTCMLLIDFVK